MSQQFTPLDPGFAEKVARSFAAQPFMTTLGAQLGVIEPGRVEVLLPFDVRLTQQHGFLHAGVSASVLDNACGYAALTLMPEDAAVLSVEFKVNMLSPAKGERFVAVGEVKKAGRTLMVCTGDLYAVEGERKKVVTTITATMMVVRGRGLQG